MAFQWVYIANLQGIPGDPLSAGALTAAQDAATARVNTMGVILETSPGAPVDVATESVPYAETVVDRAGKLSEGTFTDGTKHIPYLRADHLAIGEAATDAVSPDGGKYLFGTVDGGSRLAEDALGPDGCVPQWVLDRWASRMGASSTGLPIDIVIAAGQSNATKRGTQPAAVTIETDRVLSYSHGTGQIVTTPATDVEWIGNGFARQWVKDNPSRRAMTVEAAEGSTGFTTSSIQPSPDGYHYTGVGKGTWDRTLTADPINHYDTMIARGTAALAAAGPGARIVAVLWSQGEDDRGSMTEAQYAAKLDDLIGAARTAWAIADLPFVIGSFTPELEEDNSAGTTGIANALKDTPRRIQRTAYVPGPSGMNDFPAQRVHFAPAAQAIRGRNMAGPGYYRAALNLPTGSPITPQNITISRSGTAVTISWDAALSRVTAYVLETSTDAGTTWAPQALAGPIQTRHTMTVSASLPVWARIKTTNEVGTTDPSKEVKA